VAVKNCEASWSSEQHPVGGRDELEDHLARIDSGPGQLILDFFEVVTTGEDAQAVETPGDMLPGMGEKLFRRKARAILVKEVQVRRGVVLGHESPPHLMARKRRPQRTFVTVPWRSPSFKSTQETREIQTKEIGAIRPHIGYHHLCP
jgi:hypothetical protein